MRRGLIVLAGEIWMGEEEDSVVMDDLMAVVEVVVVEEAGVEGWEVGRVKGIGEPER